MGGCQLDRALPESATFDRFQSGLPANIKVARVVNPAILSDSEFLENVAVNRGINVKTFQDRELALKWLNE